MQLIWLAFCSIRLFQILGPAFFVRLALMFFCYHFIKYFNLQLTDKKHECKMFEEKRINITTETFENIRTIKLFGWEKHLR